MPDYIKITLPIIIFAQNVILIGFIHTEPIQQQEELQPLYGKPNPDYFPKMVFLKKYVFDNELILQLIHEYQPKPGVYYAF